MATQQQEAATAHMNAQTQWLQNQMNWQMRKAEAHQKAVMDWAEIQRSWIERLQPVYPAFPTYSGIYLY